MIGGVNKYIERSNNKIVQMFNNKVNTNNKSVLK